MWRVIKLALGSACLGLAIALLVEGAMVAGAFTSGGSLQDVLVGCALEVAGTLALLLVVSGVVRSIEVGER
jgi:hypothetical protein